MVKFRLRRSKRQEGAQGMVEFALILPLLLLVVFGIIELGRLLVIYSSVGTASREAARYASRCRRCQMACPTIWTAVVSRARPTCGCPCRYPIQRYPNQLRRRS